MDDYDSSSDSGMDTSVDTSSDVDVSSDVSMDVGTDDYSSEVAEDYGDLSEDMSGDISEPVDESTDESAEDYGELPEDMSGDISEPVDDSTGESAEDCSDLSEDVSSDISEPVDEGVSESAEDCGDLSEDVSSDDSEPMDDSTGESAEDYGELPEDIADDAPSDLPENLDKASETPEEVTEDAEPSDLPENLDEASEAPEEVTEDTEPSDLPENPEEVPEESPEVPEESGEEESISEEQDAPEEGGPVLKRDQTELWSAGNRAIDDNVEAMRDDLRDKGMADGEEMEAIVMRERAGMQQELSRNIVGDFSQPYKQSDFSQYIKDDGAAGDEGNQEAPAEEGADTGMEQADDADMNSDMPVEDAAEAGDEALLETPHRQAGESFQESPVEGTEQDDAGDLTDLPVERQNEHPEQDIEDAFDFADSRYAPDSAHWQEAANRKVEDLNYELKNNESLLADAQSQAEQKYQQINEYTQQNNLSAESAATDQTYQNLLSEYSDATNTRNSLVATQQELLGMRDDLSAKLIPEMKTTFSGFKGSDFRSAYDKFITERQGQANPDFQGTCGINETCSIVNQQTGSDMGEPEGIAEFSANGWCETGRAPEMNGGTTPLQRSEFLESKDLTFQRIEGTMDNGIGFSLDDVARRFRQGDSAGIMLKAEDLSQPELSSRKIDLFNPLGAKSLSRFYANHATTVAGFSYDEDGSASSVWLNDTGGHAGSNRVIIDRSKFMEMQNNTKGFAVEFSRKR